MSGLRHNVYVLGAGFSRAIAAAMPAMPQLRGSVLEALNLDSRILQPFADDLEQWLSHLSTDQPWLTDQDNARNHALFLDAADAIKVIIDAAEAEAMKEPIPMWLRRLALSLAAEQATVISLNYDLLLERVLTTHGVAQTWGDVYGLPLESRLPVGSHHMVSVSPAGYASILLKLHGSTNWAYGGSAAPVSDRIVLTVDGLHWGQFPAAPTGGALSLYDDLVPLIVPPTTSKSRYYSNLSLRGQWRRAAAALLSANSLTIVGYSLPPGDDQMQHFLGESMEHSIPVTVVNPDASVAARVAHTLGRSSTEVTLIDGASPIEMLVEAVCGDVVQWNIGDDGGEARPELFINGVDHSDDPGTQPRPVGDQNSAYAWLHAEIRRRWGDGLLFEGFDRQPRRDACATAKAAFAPRAVLG